MFAKLCEKLKGWKTVIINLTTGLPALLYGFYLELQTVDFTPVIPAKYVAAFVVVNSLIGIVLRYVTTGPVGAKGDEAPAPQVKAGD